MPNLIEIKNRAVSELLPQRFSSWNAYYRYKERVEKVKYWVQGTVGALMLLGVYALNGYIDYVW